MSARLQSLPALPRSMPATHHGGLDDRLRFAVAVEKVQLAQRDKQDLLRGGRDHRDADARELDLEVKVGACRQWLLRRRRHRCRDRVGCTRVCSRDGRPLGQRRRAAGGDRRCGRLVRQPVEAHHTRVALSGHHGNDQTALEVERLGWAQDGRVDVDRSVWTTASVRKDEWM